MRLGASSHARGHPKSVGRGRRQQHALKSRGKAKGPRALDVALDRRLAAWQVAAVNAGAPSSAGVEYCLAEYLGWEEDGEDEEEARDERYQCWDGEGYGEPEAYGGAVGDGEGYFPELFQGGDAGEGEGLTPHGVLPMGFAPYNVDVMGGAIAEMEQEVMEGAMAEVEQEVMGGAMAEEEQELEEAARIGHYEVMVKWEMRHQWKKDLLAGSVTLCHKQPQEDDDDEEEEDDEAAAEEEEHKSDIYQQIQHTENMKQQQGRRTLYDDSEEEVEDCIEPGEMQKKDVEDRERVMSTKREREDSEEVDAKEQQETGVEEQGPDHDFGFCKMGFSWDYVEEEDWYVVGGVVEM